MNNIESLCMLKDPPYYGIPPARGSTAFLSPLGIEDAIHNLTRAKEDLEMQILSAKALLNSRRPINGLPREVLLEIFRWALKHDSCSREHEDAERRQWVGKHRSAELLAVCRYWRALACSTPLLWTEIEIERDTPFATFKRWLAWSRSLPIRVSVKRLTSLTTFIHELSHHNTRLRELRLEDVPYAESREVSSFLHLGMPALESLCVEFGHKNSRSHEAMSISLTSDHYPILRELKLVHVGIQISSSPPLCLAVLRIVEAPAVRVSIVDFLKFLANCKQLEELSLYRCRPHDEGFVISTTPPPLSLLPTVVLPSTFQKLSLTDIDQIVARFLSALHVPPTADVNLRTLVSPNDRAETRRYKELLRLPVHSCLPHDIVGLPLISTLDRLRIQVNTNNAALHAMAGCISFSITVEKYGTSDHSNLDVDGFLNPSLVESLSIFRDCPLVELRLVGLGSRGVSGSMWTDALQPLVSLRRLTIMTDGLWIICSSQCALQFFLALGAVSPGSVMLCPQLEHMDVNVPHQWSDDSMIAAMARCMQARNAQGLRLKLLRLALGGIDSNPEDSNLDYHGENRMARPRFLERKVAYQAALHELVDGLQIFASD
ncbi:hypothetical protein C8Q76DRAFT_861071 [Earliella scabrosa]|nr:hypothetical protein C8Q76DRAFT_861071 [Earliella scabrosa]